MTLKTRGDELLLKHFSHHITMLSDTTANHTTDNMPDQTQISNFNNLRRNILEPLHHLFDTIVSGFSCRAVRDVTVTLSLNVTRKRDEVNHNILLINILQTIK